MVDFHDPEVTPLFAAGVWDEWVNKQTGEEVQSFSIITLDPPPFVADTGHDRCPLFLSPAAGKEWLMSEGREAMSLKSFLSANHSVPQLAASKFRPMKPGWEKRK